MTEGPFDPGDRIRLQRTFTAIGNAAITSVTITCTVQDPAGTETPVAITPSVASPSATGTGFFTIPNLNSSAGMWQARWASSGDITATEDVAFYVRRSPVLA